MNIVLVRHRQEGKINLKKKKKKKQAETDLLPASVQLTLNQYKSE